MRYIVREGTKRGAGKYWNGSHLVDDAKQAHPFDVQSDAESCCRALEDYWERTRFRVVSLLSASESRAKTEERGRVTGVEQALGAIKNVMVRRNTRKLIETALAALLCPCQGALDDPGPTHIATCPWSDPEYPKGQVF